MAHLPLSIKIAKPTTLFPHEELREHLQIEESPTGWILTPLSQCQIFDPSFLITFEDEDEAITDRMKSLDRHLNPTRMVWTVDITGGMTQTTTKFKLVTNDGTSYRTTHESTPYETKYASTGLIVILNTIAQYETTLEAAYRIKELIKKYPFIESSITLDETLESKKFPEIKAIKPKISIVDGGYASVEVTLSTDQGEITSFSNVSNSNMFFTAPQTFAAVSPDDKKIIDTIRNMRNQPFAKIPKNFVDLLPEGVSSEILDLSEFNPRVIGFQPAVGVNEINPNAGVTWFRKFGDPEITVAIHTTADSYEKIKFTDEEQLTATLEKYNSLRASGAQFSPTQEIKINEAQSIPFTQEAYNDLKNNLIQITAITTQNTNPPGPETTPPQPAQNLMPQIAQDHTKIAQLPTINPTLFWTTLQECLNPGLELKTHQKDGVNFLLNHYNKNKGGVLIADDMGLGKTFQTLAFIATIKKLYPGKPALVVAPLILLQNWSNEVEKFFRPGTFRPLQLHGENLKRIREQNGNTLSNEALSQYDLILTNYKTLASWWKQLLLVDFDFVAFDESQNIKTPRTTTSEAAQGIKGNFFICLTGTPVENRLRDIWPQISALQRLPNPLKELKDFQKDIEKNPEAVGLTKQALNYPGEESIILRRTKAEVISLPPMKLQIIKLPMSPTQMSLESLSVRTNQNQPLKILHDLNRIYQHPVLLQKEAIEHQPLESVIHQSPKLVWLLDTLKTIREKNEKVLIFTPFRGMQRIIEKAIHQTFGRRPGIINGETNSKDPGLADIIIKNFTKEPGFDVICASPIAAGAGLNIVAANHVIHFGRWWNPAKEDQATCRAYRIGQEKTVYVYYPILHHPDSETEGYDVKLHELVERKRSLAADFLNPAGGDISSDEASEFFGGNEK